MLHELKQGLIIGVSLIVLLIASYCFGYHARANLYKKSAEVEDGLNNLPETSAISVISRSKWGQKYTHVEIGKLNDWQSTNQHKHTPSEFGTHSTNVPTQFAFITTNTTLQQVIDRIGNYDRVRGSGISYFEYDLPDGSAVLISPEWPFSPTNRIRGVSFYRSTNEIDLYP